jgi:hypothetical protein
VSEYSTSCIDIQTDEVLISAPEHGQTSGPRTWRPPLPRPAEGPDAAGAARRVARAGRAAIRRQHPSSRRAREVSVLVWRAHIPDTYAASGPGSAAGDQGAQDRLACPAMAATRRLQPVPPQRPPGAMVPGTPASCNRQVTSTSIHRARPGPDQTRLVLLVVTHRYSGHIVFGSNKFQIADYALRGYQVQVAPVAPISAGSGGSPRRRRSMLGGSGFVNAAGARRGHWARTSHTRRVPLPMAPG